MKVRFNLGGGDDRLALWRGTIPLFAALILAGLVMRIYALGRLPGLNGDEAWYGIAALEFLDGRRFGMVTPNGNLLGPIQFSELVVLHLLFEPSAAVLRIPSLLSSVAAIALAYVAGKRIGGPPMAWLATLIMATLPINIAYARFGWDPSHSGLLVLLATCLLLGGSRIGSAVIFAASLLVHPTNLFAAPFLLMVHAGQAFEQGGDRKGSAIRSYAIMLLVGVALYYATRVSSGSMFNPTDTVRRLVELPQYAAFLRLFGDLITGETIYRYIVGNGMGPVAAPLAWLTIAGLVALLWRRLRLRAFDAKQGILLGWVASVGTFFVLAGPAAIQPHVERYGFVLVAPTALAMAVMFAPWAEDAWARWFAPAVSVVALAGFLLCYIMPLNSGNAPTHPAFWTGPVEPKAAAAKALKSFAAGRPIEVVAEDFWLYRPASYLLHGRPVQLRSREEEPALDVAGAPNSYWLVYRDSDTERRIVLAGAHRLVWASAGRSGQIRIWQPK